VVRFTRGTHPTVGLEKGLKNFSELEPWKVNGSSTILKNRWIDLRADDCTTPAGVSVSPYYVLGCPDWAHCACFDQDGRICVVKQYRHGSRVMMELPGGVVEVDEDPLEAAKRELREETGIHATDWRQSGNFSPNPATHTNRFFIFACRVRSIEAPDLQASEEIQ
jgi:8-oxo-dGDP phosphatase